MAAICASLFTTPLMMAGVNAALPEIGASFHASAGQLGMVGAMYSLGLAIFQLSSGSLGDICGHRRLFLFGCLVFSASSIAAGFVSSLFLFIGVRFIQGLGGAMISASGLALLASAAKGEHRPAYLGMSSAAVYAGIASGPPLAGLIAGTLGWRWIFWLNGVTSMIVWVLMKYTASHEWRPSKGKSYDLTGCLLYAIAITALTQASLWLATKPVAGLGAMLIFFIGIFLFFAWEKKARFPLLDLALLQHNKILKFSALAAFINYASFFGLIFYFSFYLQIAKNMTVQQAGLILAIQAVAQVAATQPATRLCARFGKNIVCAIGAALCGLGLCAAAFLSADNPVWILIVTQILVGMGISAFALANTALILDNAGASVGQASALTGAVRTAGQLCGMIFITLTLSYFLGQAEVTVNTLPEFFASMRVDLILFGILNLLAICCVFMRGENRN